MAGFLQLIHKAIVRSVGHRVPQDAVDNHELLHLLLLLEDQTKGFERRKDGAASTARLNLSAGNGRLPGNRQIKIVSTV